MKKLNQTGVIHSPILAGLFILAAIWFVAFRVYDNQTENEGNNTNTTQNTTQNELTQEEHEAPAGWVVYEDQEHGFSFSYPEEWGRVVEGEAYFEQDEYEGEVVVLEFTENKDISMAFHSHDFIFTGGNRGITSPYGFTDFQERFVMYDGWESAQELRKTENDIVIAHGEIIVGSVQLLGASRLETIPGIEYVHKKLESDLNFSEEEKIALANEELDPLDYFTEEEVEIFIQFSETIKPIN